MIWTISTKCLSIFNAYANSVALAKIGWKDFLVYTGTLLVTGTLLYFLIVETKGYTFEEIAVLFDGDDTGFNQLESGPLTDNLGSKDAVGIRVAAVDEKGSV